jgi:hypothetical protein
MHMKDNGNDNNNKNSSSSPLPSKHSEEEEIKSRRERLTRILQMLKISHDSQISETAFKSIEKATIEQTKTYGYSIVALNVIANSYLATKHILSSLIWNFVKQGLPRDDIPSRPQSYQSQDFGALSQKEITQIIKQRTIWD